MASVPDGGTRSRLTVPCAAKSVWIAAADVAYGRFLTRMHVADRGPGRPKASTLTFCCACGHASTAPPSYHPRGRAAHALKVALRLRQGVRFGQGDFDCGVRRRGIEQGGLRDTEAVGHCRESCVGLHGQNTGEQDGNREDEWASSRLDKAQPS